MCGLFGAIGLNLSQDQIAKVEDLAILSAFRGVHSTGMTIITRTGKGNRKKLHDTTYKNLGVSHLFLTLPNVRKALVKKEHKIAMMGHTRHATFGDKDALELAHPHIEGPIIGTHNGTINRYGAEAHREKTSDSVILIRNIAEKGIKETYQDAWFGALAVVWVNMEEKSINFFRNKERPLHLMLSADGTIMYWASEAIFLKFLAARDPDTEFGDPYLLKEELHVKLSLFDPRERELTEVKKSFAPQVNHFRGYRARAEEQEKKAEVDLLEEYGEWWRHHNSHGAPATSPFAGGKTEPVPRRDIVPRQPTSGVIALGDSSKKEAQKTTELDPDLFLYQYYKNELLHVDDPELIRKLGDGCVNCEDPKEVQDKDVHWVSEHEFICGKCLKEDSLMHHMFKDDRSLFPAVLIEFEKPKENTKAEETAESVLAEFPRPYQLL